MLRIRSGSPTWFTTRLSRAFFGFSREPNPRPVHSMDLTYYMRRRLPNPCELYLMSAGRDVWVFVCQLYQSDLHIGTVRRSDAQTVKLRSFHLKPMQQAST